MRHLEHDRLVQLAAASTEYGTLESRTSVESAHLGSCSDCRASLGEIRQTFALVGTEKTPVLEDPSGAVWQRISAATAETGSPVARAVAGHGRARAGRWVAAAAAVIGCLVGAGATTIALSMGSDEPVAEQPSKPQVLAAAALAVPTGSGDASGTARLIQEEGRWVLLVDTRGLAPRGGYFEVWLLDQAGRMYALGVLPEGSTARLAVPEGISIAQFNVVDISAQQFDGNPSHSRDSVLRGTLRS